MPLTDMHEFDQAAAAKVAAAPTKPESETEPKADKPKRLTKAEKARRTARREMAAQAVEVLVTSAVDIGTQRAARAPAPRELVGAFGGSVVVLMDYYGLLDVAGHPAIGVLLTGAVLITALRASPVLEAAEIAEAWGQAGPQGDAAI